MLRNIPPGYFRYGVSLVFVGIALFLSLATQSFLPDGFLIFFLAAVMLAGWFGRTGPGILAVIVSMAAVAYFFIPPHRAFAVELDELPYFLSFLLSAVVTSWLGSARRHAEERQRAHLEELFEQTPEAIMLVDLHDRVLRVNREFTSLFGYEKDSVLNQQSLNLIVPEALRSEALDQRQQLAKGQTVSMETVRKCRDGSTIDVSEVSFPVVADDKCIAYYTIFRDITPSKRALENLQKAQADLAHLARITTMGELASSIAHEINQPIGAIAMNGDVAVSWLDQDPPNIKGAREALQCIVRDANRAAQVIERIRALLRNNQSPLVPLDVNSVIREVLVLTNHETHKRNASVITDLSTRLPLVLGDRVQLQQVMLNLIMNSLDSMNNITDRPRQLVIQSQESRDIVTVSVRDSGCGWTERNAALMFEPFYTTKKDGIGMGLTISRSIIEGHGGRLWAELAAPHGAVMNFSLPIAADTK
jgi:PAS domain S-box-containing protein